MANNFNQIFGTNPILLAPMFEISNLPFRLLCQKQGSNGGVTEFVSVNQLLHVFTNKLEKENPVQYMIQTIEEEKPVGLQVFGFDPSHFEELSRVFDPIKFGFDFLDLNVGCPVPKICATGSGSRLLSQDKLQTLEKILKSISKSFPDIPFSVKIRAGYKEKFDMEKLSELLNSIELLMVTIHPKLAVVKKGDENIADHTLTSTLVERLNHPVVVNGGIYSLNQAKSLMQETKASGAMIGRQAMRYPFVFNENFQNSINTGDYINGMRDLLHLSQKYGFSKLYMIRDQISNMVRAFKGSKNKRTELQVKLYSIDQLVQFVDNLELFFQNKNISQIPRIISKNVNI